MNKNEYIKEILVITASLHTIDNENLHFFKDIKIHFISLRGDIFFFKNVACITHGRYFVSVYAPDIDNFFDYFCLPNSINTKSTINLLRLGFPQYLREESICACCFKLSNEGFECPVCNTKVCTLPIKCPVCNTQLVTSNILSQSFYYCYPLEKFVRNEGICRICEKE